MAKATFAAGSFWAVEASFQKIDGVTATSTGYTGGTTDNPTYEQVSSGDSDHVEAVQIQYDEEIVMYDDLLQVFWDSHDPTTPDRQGDDIGPQYRSVIFFHDEDQEEEARVSKQVLSESGQFDAPIVTEIVAATKFWKAEDEHQKFFEKQGISQM